MEASSPTTSTPSPSIAEPMPSLPPEIIASILENADRIKPTAETYVSHGSDVKTMAAACLVSRTFLPFARRLLYATIRLKAVKIPRPETEELDETARIRHAADPEAYKPTDDSLALVEAATLPHLSAFARTLVVDLGEGTGDKLAEAVTNLLRDCTGVTQVFIVNLRNPGTSTNALLNAFTMHGQRIRQLKMLACASLHHTSEAPPLYSAFESLEELTVHVSLFQASEEEPLAVVVPQSLRRYHQISSIMNIPLPNLLQYSFKTLQHLELDPTSDSDDDFQLSRFKKLETLQYRIAQPSLEQAEILLDTIDSARKLKTLQSIELSVHCGRGFEDDSGEDKKAFLDCLTNDRFLCRLPPSTTSLRLCGADLPLETVVSWVKDLPLKPSLRQLGPPPSYWLRLMETEGETLIASTFLEVTRAEFQAGRLKAERIEEAEAELRRAGDSGSLCTELEVALARRGMSYIGAPLFERATRRVAQSET